MESAETNEIPGDLAVPVRAIKGAFGEDIVEVLGCAQQADRLTLDINPASGDFLEQVDRLIEADAALRYPSVREESWTYAEMFAGTLNSCAVVATLFNYSKYSDDLRAEIELTACASPEAALATARQRVEALCANYVEAALRALEVTGLDADMTARAISRGIEVALHPLATRD